MQGAVYVVLCCILIAMTTLIARALGPQIAGDAALHPVQVSWGRFFFGACTIIPIAMIRGVRLNNTPWLMHLGRIALGLGGVIGMFAAAGLMVLTDATAISFLSPLFSMIFAIIFLRETIGPWRWLAAGIAFLGAMVLTRPGLDTFQPAALIALSAACFLGAELIFIKKLSGRDWPLKILAINNGLAALFISIAVIYFWKAPTPMQWAMLVALGVIMVSAQTLFLKGIAMAEANVAAPFFYTTLIFATVYGWIVFGEVPGIYSLIGAGLIVCGALLLTWRENLARKRTITH
ncbi:MAG: DMT family transporter [Alphaproteobacteria bacterium]|nr:DMT family transporter [Alphaproteobacteria bacterium]